MPLNTEEKYDRLGFWLFVSVVLNVFLVVALFVVLDTYSIDIKNLKAGAVERGCAGYSVPYGDFKWNDN